MRSLKVIAAALLFSLSSAVAANQLGPLATQVKYLSGWGKNCPKLDPQQGGNWDGPLRFNIFQVQNVRVLIIAGTFTAGDSERLSQFLAQNGRISEIWLDSGGGDATEGPKVGEVIRNARLPTRVAAGYACISSCSMAFLGGVLRYIDDGAVYGIHTFYNDSMLGELQALKTTEAMKNYLHSNEQGNAILAGDIQRYGQKMGISRDFFPDVMFKQRSLIFVSDAQIVAMRKEMALAHNGASANAYIRRLRSSGILRLESQDQAQEMFDFLLEAHSQADVDAFISPMLQTFECIDRQQLNRYNVINVVRR